MAVGGVNLAAQIIEARPGFPAMLTPDDAHHPRIEFKDAAM